MTKLRMKLYNMQFEEKTSSTNKLRKKQMGQGNRNERIRTYNFNQSRVTDHRLENGTMYNLEGFLQGGEYLLKTQEKLEMEFKRTLLAEIVKNY